MCCAVCSPARRPHASGVGKCCPGSNPQTHGWAQASFCGLRIRSLSVSPAGAMESRPANAVHSRKSVIFYPVILICIVASVRSKSLRKPISVGHTSPLPQWSCRVACGRHYFSACRTRFPPPSKKAVPGRGRLFLCDGDHQILVMSTRSTSLMVVSMSRHSVRAMAVSTAVRQAMDRSTALRRICTECSAGLRPVALVEIR